MTAPELETRTPIQKFFSGQSILVTGATGFLGTVLIEKLLRTCSDLNTIYIVIRNKKGKNLQTRLDQYFEDLAFHRLKNEFPKFRHKVVGVSGDCSLPELGISSQDKQMIINEVSVVFHVAATVRFDEKLKLAVAINVRGTQEIIKLAQQMPHLKSMVHVSTIYSFVNNKVIEEVVYPTPIESKKLILMTETLADNILDHVTPLLLDKWPNTYTYTKAIAEDLVRQEACNLPIGIFRPSVVISSYKEPLSAWINNLYGPTGVCAGAGSGLLRALYTNPKVTANLVPVDLCVNSLIATAWDVGTKFEENRTKNVHVPVYHYESSNESPLTWKTYMHYVQKHGLDSPSIKAIWYYSFTMISNYYFYLVAIFFLHYLPALLVDIALVCVGKSPKMLQVYKKIHKFSDVISYFSTRNWTFVSHRNRDIINRMTDQDKELFFCDIKKVDWNDYFRLYIRGIRIYLLQDPMETLESARSRWKRLYWLHQVVKVLIAFLLLRVAWWILSLFF